MSLRHRHEYAVVLPRGLLASFEIPAREFPAPVAGAHRIRPRSARFEPVASLRDVKRRFLAYSSPSRSPDPPHLAVLARPGFVRAAPALPGTTRIRLPSAPPPCYDRAGGEGLPPPLEPQRLTAQLEADPGAQVRRRPFNTGHVSARHAAIRASSRSAARRAGTCTLHPIRCSSKSTPARVYSTLNRERITAAMRASVQH